MTVDDSLEQLNNFDHQKHTFAETLELWAQTYEKRMSLLEKTERRTKIVTVAKYFQTFGCLKPPQAVILVIDSNVIFQTWCQSEIFFFIYNLIIFSWNKILRACSVIIEKKV